MAAQPDLWGEIVPAKVRTPLAVLREQAALLGPKTKNLVEAKVTTGQIADRGEFVHHFNLVVPALDNYTYELFRVAHGVALYPVRIPGTHTSFQSEEALLDWLRQKLSAPETKGIIANLFSQVTT